MPGCPSGRGTAAAEHWCKWYRYRPVITILAWMDPGRDGNFGVILVGMPDNVRQGVNEKELACDADGLA
jgi:hypothetical protein